MTDPIGVCLLPASGEWVYDTLPRRAAHAGDPAPAVLNLNAAATRTDWRMGTAARPAGAGPRRTIGAHARRGAEGERHGAAATRAGMAGVGRVGGGGGRARGGCGAAKPRHSPHSLVRKEEGGVLARPRPPWDAPGREMATPKCAPLQAS